MIRGYNITICCYTSLGSLPISMEVKSLPSSLPDTNDTDLPPPIPPKLFLDEELFLSPPNISKSVPEHYSTAPTKNKPGQCCSNTTSSQHIPASGEL